MLISSVCLDLFDLNYNLPFDLANLFRRSRMFVRELCSANCSTYADMANKCTSQDCSADLTTFSIALSMAF